MKVKVKNDQEYEITMHQMEIDMLKYIINYYLLINIVISRTSLEKTKQYSHMSSRILL
jgi:hypothetical protein